MTALILGADLSRSRGSWDSVAGADAVFEFENENAVFDRCGWDADGVVEADIVLRKKRIIWQWYGLARVDSSSRRHRSDARSFFNSF